MKVKNKAALKKILVIYVQCHIQVVFSILEYNINCNYNVQS
jgi:hypothetical protein